MRRAPPPPRTNDVRQLRDGQRRRVVQDDEPLVEVGLLLGGHHHQRVSRVQEPQRDGRVHQARVHQGDRVLSHEDRGGMRIAASGSGLFFLPKKPNNPLIWDH